MDMMSWSDWTLAQAGNPVGMPGATASNPPAGGAPSAPASTGAQPLPPPAPGSGGAPGMGGFLWIAIGMMVLLMVTNIFAGRKEKKRQAELMSSLKRNDRVQTSGGILGTVVEVGEKEVVLRVEEGRIRVLRGAVQTIINPSKAPAGVEAKPADAKAGAATS